MTAVAENDNNPVKQPDNSDHNPVKQPDNSDHKFVRPKVFGTPFKKGQSGNPKGRPKGKKLTDYIADYLKGELAKPDGSAIAREQLIAESIVRLLMEELGKKKFDSALFGAIFSRRDPPRRTIEVRHREDDTPKIVRMPLAGPPDDTLGMEPPNDDDEDGDE